jgi:hypothetical protein
MFQDASGGSASELLARADIDRGRGLGLDVILLVGVLCRLFAAHYAAHVE